MKGKSSKNKILWTACSVLALCVGFLLCRYVFFELHLMKQWPTILMVAGILAIAIAMLFNARKVMLCTPIGYICGFILGIILNTEGVDQGGGATNNLWLIWTIVFIAAIIVGIIWELISNHIMRKTV